VPEFQQPVVTTNFSHSAVQSSSVQSTPTLTSPPSTSVHVSLVTQINSSSLSAVTETKTTFDQTPLDLYADLNLALTRPMGTTKTNTNVVSATQMAPTVLPIETSGYVSQSETSSTLVDQTNFETSTSSATSISAAQVFTSALPNSLNTTVVAPSMTSGNNVIPPTALSVAKAPVLWSNIEPIVPILDASAKLTIGKLMLKRLNIYPWR